MATEAGASRLGPANPPYLIVIGSSAGGLQALTCVLEGLPADLPAAVIIVQHMAPHFESRLAEILNSRGRLPVVQARSGVRIERGRAYIAPPNLHIELDRFGRIRLSSSARVNFSRPSVDTLFVSAAATFAGRVIAVVLTGFGRDGAAGVMEVKARGGIVLVQDEATSQNFGMPGAAINTGIVDRIVPLEHIPGELLRLMKMP